jgi:Cu2+-exporting ATPase
MDHTTVNHDLAPHGTAPGDGMHDASHPAGPAPDEHAGHDKHAGHSPEMFRDRLLVSVVLTIPILYFSPQIQEWFGYEAISFPGSEWVATVLATVLFFYGGGPFLRGAAAELRVRRPGMMTLIAIAVTVAYTYSVAVSFGFPGEDFYWELATLIDVMLLGHWIEMRSVVSASSASLQRWCPTWRTVSTNPVRSRTYP